MTKLPGRFIKVALLVLLVSPPAATHAAAPTIDSAGVTATRHLEADWTLPAGMKNYVIEVAAGSGVQSTGPEEGFFLLEHRLSLSITSGSTLTTWRSPARVATGTYYIHVGAYDSTTCPLLTAECQIEFSETRAVVVPPPPPRPPTITSATSSQRRIEVRWAHSLGTSSERVEVARSPEVYGPGSGPLEGRFLYPVASRALGTDQGSFLSQLLSSGVYYVHVGARDDATCSYDPVACRMDFSPSVTVVVPPDPPVLRSLDLSDHLIASWSLPADLSSDLIEVATSPEVYPSGPGEGEFLIENTVFADLLFYWERSYESLEPLELGPGTYYVHVGAYEPSNCSPAPPDCLIYEFSDTVSFTIPGPPSPASPAPPAPPAPAAAAKAFPSFTLLHVPKRQSVRRVSVRAVLKQRGTLTANGTVKVPGAARVFRFRTAFARAAAGVPVNLRLRLPRKASRTVKRALRRRQLRADITITARDEAGNARIEKRRIRLSR